MSNRFRAYAAKSAGAKLEPFEIELGELSGDQVEIAVQYCGICHSDLSMYQNEWGMTAYPFVPGHEIVGKVVAVGPLVQTIQVGQMVGVGWYAGSCLHCRQCLSGDQNLCAKAQPTIVGRYGGFAERIRCQEVWTIPLTDGLDYSKLGPLFCGGITVFNPILQFDVKPTDRVGVIGIGGLGHMAIRFLNKWGCEVTAFTSSDNKREEALALGAHNVVNSRDSKQLGKLKGSLNFIISTVNVKLDWESYMACLAPHGRLHTVGAVLEPISVSAFPLLIGQKSLSGSPVGSPVSTQIMVDFCHRHQITPMTETFPMSKVNEAMEHVEAGKARYRVVLENDWK